VSLPYASQLLRTTRKSAPNRVENLWTERDAVPGDVFEETIAILCGFLDWSLGECELSPGAHGDLLTSIPGSIAKGIGSLSPQSRTVGVLLLSSPELLSANEKMVGEGEVAGDVREE